MINRKQDERDRKDDMQQRATGAGAGVGAGAGAGVGAGADANPGPLSYLGSPATL